jgi:hypothetical protein
VGNDSTPHFAWRRKTGQTRTESETVLGDKGSVRMPKPPLLSHYSPKTALREKAISLSHVLFFYVFYDVILSPGLRLRTQVQRRDFLKIGVASAAATRGIAKADVPAHNWGNYDFGSGPKVSERLNQGPFPQYPPAAVIPTDDVVMTTTPSDDVVRISAKDSSLTSPRFRHG